MSLVVEMNLSAGGGDDSVELTSFNFGRGMVVVMVINVNFVIVHDRTFGVQCDNCGLQSFNFNFLFGNDHLSIVKFVLDVIISSFW